MLSEMKWVRFAMAVLVVLAMLCGSTLAKKPPKDPPPEPDPPPVTYTITWLDSFAGSFADAVNSHGHVVGEAKSPERYGGERFAFVYTPETGMVDLNTLLPQPGGWHLRYATDINDRGQIVGSAYLTGVETPIAYRYTPALLAEDGSELLPANVEALGPLHADDEGTIATGINERGEVCGYSVDAEVSPSSSQYHVWFYSDEVGMVTVMSASDGNWLLTRSINESSQILVSLTRYEGPQSAIRVFPFGDPEYFYSEGSQFEVSDINDSGHFVGLASFVVPINKKRTTTESRAAYHDGNTLLDLGAGHARGINNHGDVVGFVNAQPRCTGFIYYKELQQVVNLDTAIVGDEMDLFLWFHETSDTSPRRINDAGQIVGSLSNYDLFEGYQAFVLTPIPPEN